MGDFLAYKLPNFRVGKRVLEAFLSVPIPAEERNIDSSGFRPRQKFADAFRKVALKIIPIPLFQEMAGILMAQYRYVLTCPRIVPERNKTSAIGVTARYFVGGIELRHYIGMTTSRVSLIKRIKRGERTEPIDWYRIQIEFQVSEFPSKRGPITYACDDRASMVLLARIG